MSSLPAWGAWIEIPQLLGKSYFNESLPAWGAWIEIRYKPSACQQENRSPHGERGLKYNAWVMGVGATSRSPHGERGLKLQNGLNHHQAVYRSPHGERGLKCFALI